jgi:hypothetical protein
MTILLTRRRVEHPLLRLLEELGAKETEEAYKDGSLEEQMMTVMITQ